MKIVLAILAFMVGALLLAFAGLNSYAFASYIMQRGFVNSKRDLAIPLVTVVVSFIIGIAFVIAGLGLLNSKERSKQ